MNRVVDSIINMCRYRCFLRLFDIHNKLDEAVASLGEEEKEAFFQNEKQVKEVLSADASAIQELNEESAFFSRHKEIGRAHV